MPTRPSRDRPEADCGVELGFEAAGAVRAAVARLGRTEDVSFSPSNRRLALSAFDHDTVAIVDVEITVIDDRPHVSVTNVTEVASPRLLTTHGVAFVDDDTVLVASRDASVAVLHLAPDDGISGHGAQHRVDELPGPGFEHLGKPSALSIFGDPLGDLEVLVCNNAGHTVTRHELHLHPPTVTRSEVMLHRLLDLPNGVAVSDDDRWIAVSNHDAHTVLLYDRATSPGVDSDPDGILLGAIEPHGVRFGADGRHLFVADGGAPYLHVYRTDGEGWRGVRSPVSSTRVVAGGANSLGPSGEVRGPKGIALDAQQRVLAMTSEDAPLRFFDVGAILEHGTERRPDDEISLRYELKVLEHASASKEHIDRLRTSTSYRITAPLRRLSVAWSRVRR